MPTVQTPVATSPALVTQTKTPQEDLTNQRTECEVWTRVMGYHRPVANFNVGKKSEYLERTQFSEATTTNNTKFTSKYC